MRELIETDFLRRPLPEGAGPAAHRPDFAEVLEYTAWALRAFRDRAERDGARPVVLAHESSRRRRALEPLRSIAGPLGVPVLDLAETLLREGVDFDATRFPHEGHWNPAGHRFAARTVLDYLAGHPEVCDRPRPPPPGGDR